MRFDWSHDDYDTPTDFELIPEGTEVRMVCVEAEEKTTSSGGEMIACKFKVTEGEHKGRYIWTNFNVVNSSEKAQNFGRRMVAGWARACGKPNAKNTDELLEKQFWAKLGIEKGTGQYKDKNTIASYLMPTESSSQKPEGSSQKSEKPATGAAEPESTSTEAPAKPAEKPASAPKPASGKKAPWDD